MDTITYNRDNIIADTVILYIGIFTNLGVIIHLHKTWVSRNRVQFYVLSLCLADCLGLILRQCTEIGLHTTSTWNTDTLGCKIIMSMAMSGTSFGHFLLVSFNLDNLLTVVYKQSWHLLRIMLVILAIFLTGGGISAKAYLYNIEVHPIYTELRMCTPFGQLTGEYEMTYKVVEVIVLFWFPAVLIVIFAVFAVILMKKGSEKSRNDDDDDEDEDQPQRDMFSLKSDLIYTSVLDCCFLLSWLPYSTMQILLATNTRLIKRELWSLLWDGFTYLSMVHPCMNPLIYGSYCLMRGPCTKTKGVPTSIALT